MNFHPCFCRPLLLQFFRARGLTRYVCNYRLEQLGPCNSDPFPHPTTTWQDPKPHPTPTLNPPECTPTLDPNPNPNAPGLPTHPSFLYSPTYATQEAKRVYAFAKAALRSSFQHALIDVISQTAKFSDATVQGRHFQEWPQFS